MLEIRMGGLTILGRPDDGTTHVEGLFVGPDGFHGWDDGVDSRGESVERPDQHGEFDMPVFLGSRVVTIDGHALAWSDVELGHLRKRVMGLGATGDRFRVAVEHQGETLWATARRAGKPTFTDSGIRSGMHRASFVIQFTCRDPRKYGEIRDYAAGEAAAHYGNFPATPRLLIGAGAGGYTVTGPGGRVVTVGTAPAGAHEIDFVTGGLYLGGARQVNAITVYQPWSIPPGLPGVTATISGARTLTQRVTDTFI